MSAKNFLILLVAAVIGVAAAAVAVITRPGDVTYANQGDPVFPGLVDAVNKIDRIRIESDEGGVLTFKRTATDRPRDGKEAAGWGIVERGMYPAKAGLVKGLAVRVSQLTYMAPKTDNPELYPRLDLGDPDQPGSHSVRLKLMAEDGAELADLVVGTSRPIMEGSTAGGTYFRLPGQDQAWVAKGNVDVGNLISNWIETDLFDVPTDRIKRVEIHHPDGEQVIVVKEKKGDQNFQLRDVPEDRKVKSPYDVNSVASSIDEFKVLDVVPASEKSIDESRSVHVVYETFDGMTVRAWLEPPKSKSEAAIPAEEEYWSRLEIEGGKGEYEDQAEMLRARTEGWVYRLSDYRYDAIVKHMADLTEDAKTGS